MQNDGQKCVFTTSFFVLYFVSSFEMAPFAACKMIVRDCAWVCVLVCMQSLCFLSFVFLHWGADAPSKFPSYFLTYTSPSALVPICWNDCTICWRWQTFCQSFCSLKKKKEEMSKNSSILSKCFLLFLYVCAVHSSQLYYWNENKRLFFSFCVFALYFNSN